MSDWFPIKITDYWDNIPDAIYLYSRRLANLDKADRQTALLEIQNGVKEHVKVLSDKHLQIAAFCMVEDLYKSVMQIPIFDEFLMDYLAASAGTFNMLLKDRGYVVHYIVDNTFSADELNMRGPIDIFPDVFRSSGFKYVCPQDLALMIMEDDGIDTDEYFSELPRYISEARNLCNTVLGKCHENDDSYFFLDTDSVSDSFNFSLAAAKQQGVINIFRNDAPTKGSKASVIFPQIRKK